MEDLDNVKRTILAYIQRKRSVKLSELRQWALENNIGILTLYLSLSRLIQERQKDLTLGPPEPLISGNIKLMGKSLDLKLPSEITIQDKAKRREGIKVNQRKRIRGQRTLLDVLSSEEATKREQEVRQEVVNEVKETTVQVQGVEAEVKDQGNQSEETPIKQPEQVEQSNTQVNQLNQPAVEEQVKGTGNETIDPSQLTLSQLSQLVASELRISTEEATRLISSIGQYLNRYWSVGLLRLIEDTVRGSNPDLIQRLLKVLERLGFIELTNPGIVNRRRNIKFPVSDAKISDLV
ncbi:hypothetical protein [Caldivirga maquilingensis]|uniref:Uncharacterized protein n=1 Tax=Caldivirga maquilingensis (strain ATCC 700844 / DSM 13496 / JCM 10307 / IC-167) TaxID=397948 RepID=A8MDT8_CALMQ|nr:hypothetical protein [Caldivirga maquilingensis]ABW01944.1 hypothetical protein Cmaq_1116 [Caldivirga maquilingensis IC-167]